MISIRPAVRDDLPFLEAMLYEAFFWDPAMTRPPFAVVRGEPEFARILAGWGRHGDRALVAGADGARAGAAWFRLWTRAAHSYGFVDEATPELGIAVVAGRRRTGIGRRLLRGLIEQAREDGFPALSLSVSPQNPALRLYESEGFRRAGESGTSWTLRLALAAHEAGEAPGGPPGRI